VSKSVVNSTSLDPLAVRPAGPDGQRPEVLFLTARDLTNPEGGGSELYVERVAAGMSADGADVTFFCADHGKAPRDEVKDGVRYVRRGGRHTVYLRAAWLLLTGRLGRRGVIVEVHNGVPFLARLWSHRRVWVLVHHVHREQWSVVFGPLGSRIGWWLESRLATRVNHDCPYVAVSEVTKAELATMGVEPERTTVVYNGTPPPLDTTVQRAAVPTVVVLGRVVPHKRVEIALRAVAELRDRWPDLHCDVAGDGYWMPHLRALVTELGLEDAVTLHGRVSEQTKADLLAHAWVHAVPSLKEGWGLSVMEAATHGTPSLAFRDAGGLAESVQDGRTGLLVDHEPAFVAALDRLIGDDGLRTQLGQQARTRAADFSWASTTSAFEHVIHLDSHLDPVRQPV
jgi:glycosyltransferase involved in cell wall biosynthesis